MKEIRVMLICAMGMSSSILVKNLKKYASECDIDIDLVAVNQSEVLDAEKKDLYLIAPQLSYRSSYFANLLGQPIISIDARDYALGNVKNVLELIMKEVGTIND